MRRGVVIGGLLLALGLAANPWGPALAQSGGAPRDHALEVAPRDWLGRGPGRDAETHPPRLGGVPRGARPSEISALHDPVFLEQFTRTIPAAPTASGAVTSGVRVGPSGWIAAPAPFDRREVPAGIAVGLSVAWPAVVRPEAPNQAQRCAAESQSPRCAKPSIQETRP